MNRKDYIPYNKTIWTEEMISFLRDNWDKMTNPQLADHLGLRLTTTRTKMYQLGLKRIEMEYWTPEQVDFLLEHYREWGDVEIAEYFNENCPKKKRWTEKHINKKKDYLLLFRTSEEIDRIRIRNKAQGRYTKNHWKRWDGRKCEIGTIKIWDHQSGPVVHIKVSHDCGVNNYLKLAHYNYIKEHGTIPAGHVIKHRDGNSLNCEPANLECISKADSMRLNRDQDNDNVIATLLTYGDKELRAQIIKMPALIELKREQLKLKREIKNAVRKTA